jgi:hypothetical protein
MKWKVFSFLLFITNYVSWKIFHNEEEIENVGKALERAENNKKRIFNPEKFKFFRMFTSLFPSICSDIFLPFDSVQNSLFVFDSLGACAL